MDLVRAVLHLLLYVFFLLLIGRLIFDWIQVFARQWRPTGIAVVIIEAVFTVTDPPIKALRRILPPIPLGPVRLDLSLMIVMIVVLILMSVMRGLASSTAASAVAAGLL